MLLKPQHFYWSHGLHTAEARLFLPLHQVGLLPTVSALPQLCLVRARANKLARKQMGEAKFLPNLRVEGIIVGGHSTGAEDQLNLPC